MKKSIYLFISLIFILGSISCGEKGPLKGYKKITKIFGYQIISDMTHGTKPGNGIFMVANAIVKTDQDSAVSEPNLGGGFTFQVPLRAPKSGSDLMKGFQKLSEGDSAVFIMLADTFFSPLNFNMKLPENVKSGSYVKLYIQVLRLLDSSQYDIYVEEQEIQNKVLARQTFDAYIKVAGITQEPDNNGIIKIVEKEGYGKSPTFGQTVTLHMVCLTMTGQEIANTYMQGAPDEFVLGDSQMIDGLNFSLIKMKKGEKSRLIIPYYLAYKEQGAPGVPPYAHLIMDVELLDFK